MSTSVNGIKIITDRYFMSDKTKNMTCCFSLFYIYEKCKFSLKEIIVICILYTLVLIKKKIFSLYETRFFQSIICSVSYNSTSQLLNV